MHNASIGIDLSKVGCERLGLLGKLHRHQLGAGILDVLLKGLIVPVPGGPAQGFSIAATT